LEAFLEGHLNPAGAIVRYDRGQAILPKLDGAEDWRALDDPAEVSAISAAATSPGVNLTADEIVAVIAFLGSLSDQVALKGRLGIPVAVPSGLPLDR
jgi:cytochrome c peroxidase